MTILPFYMPDGRKYENGEIVTFVNDSLKDYLLYEGYINENGIQNIVLDRLGNEFDLKMKQGITGIQQENKADLLINRLLLTGRIMAECHIGTELSQEFIKTHDELKEYHKKIIEEYENKIAPKFIKVDDIIKYHSFNTKDKKYGEGDNVEEAMNKRTRN